MIVTHEEIIIPLRWDFLGLFVVIGVGGFSAQTLFTMGLQREAAGRATLAMYVGVRLFVLPSNQIWLTTALHVGRIRNCVREDLLRHFALYIVADRHGHHLRLRSLCCSTSENNVYARFSCSFQWL